MTPLVDPYEELASLFLSDAAPTAHASGERRMRAGFAPKADELADQGQRADQPAKQLVPSAAIEIALVGHLPVMGGLWLTQYADQIARHEGPTALVRLERGQVTVELLRADQVGRERGGLDGVETVDEAIHLLAPLAEHWIVCPQGEAALDGPLPGEVLTLLTGSDDAATVAAYRIMKNLAERWHAAKWTVPPIGLVVLGAPQERVDEVADKLDRTTKAFLDVDLTVTAQHQRMDAIESAGRRTFPGVEMSVADVARRIRAAAPSERRAASSARRAADARPAVATSPGPVAKLGPKGIVRETPPASPSTPHVEVLVKSSAAAAARPRAPKLSSLAAIMPGLEALPIRAPGQPLVELAVDAHGGLHLLADLDALVALRAVENWAIAHGEILRMACPRLADLERITGHVVTTDAPTIVPLHGSGLRLHLLIETPAGPMCAPLN